MKTMLIGLSKNKIPEAILSRISQLAADYQVVISDQRNEMEKYLSDVEIIAGSIPLDWILRAPNLRWYQQWGAGADWLMRRPEIARKNFILTNASGVHSIPITEHILALILALTRQLPEAFRAQQKHTWVESEVTEELAGKTALLIGVGAIGKQTALVLSAMGMYVIGILRNPGKPLPGVSDQFCQADLKQVLPQADFIILTVPLTNETWHMLDERAFELMKPGAYVINIGRGATIDETALTQALLSGKIAGAGLDVFEEEPLPGDSLLWDMPNVIITAHYAGNTPYYDQRALNIFLENLERYTTGRPLLNIVDKSIGY